MHEHQLRGVESSTAVKGDVLLTYVRFLLPLAGSRERRATRSTCIRRCMGSVDRPARAKVRAPFSERSPSSNRPRTSLSCVRAREEDGCAPSASPARTGYDVPRERDAPTAEILCSAPPREGRSGRRGPRCVPPLCARIVPRRLLLVVRPGGLSRHAAPVYPEGLRRFAARSACAFWTTSRCPA